MRVARWIRWGAALAALAAAGYLAVVVATLPDVRPLARQHPTRTSYMQKRADEASRTPVTPVVWTALDSISPYLLCAVVKAEDLGFFRHHGFDWRQTRKALRLALGGQPSMGGSTITQQVARNVYLGPERSPARKLREALIAVELERALSKRRILEIYLNVIEWGDGIWGAGAASRSYFGKPPAELDLFEVTLLASLIAAPRRPLTGANRERARMVQRRSLFQLYRSGLVTAQGFLRARYRSDDVFAALARGAPLAVALNTPRRDGGVGPIAGGVPLSTTRAVDEECGLAREIAVQERIAREQARRRATR